MDKQLELYKSIIDDAVDAIFIGDEKGNFIIVNKSAEQLTGYTKIELLTLNMSNLFHQKVLKNSPLKYKSLDESQVITRERNVVKKNGSLVSVEMKSKKLESGNYQCFMRDITERKKKEKELKESEEKYKALFELSPTGILVEDSTGNIIEANQAIHENFGYKKNELIGKNITAITHPEIQNEIKKNINKILNGDSLNHIVKSLKKDGTKSYNELYETKINLPNIGNGILSISNDITKQILAEQTLKENELKFRNIIEHSNNLFYTHTADHKLTYVSPQSKIFFDCEPEEALIKWTDFVTDNPLNKLGFEKTQKAIETGIAQEPYELELINKKGKKILVEVHETPVVENGRTVSIVGALIDITFRRKLESSYQELFEYAPIAISEEDVTELFVFLDELKESGINDFKKYFDDNSKVVYNCAKKIKPIRINSAGLKLYEVKNISELQSNYENIFTQKSLNVFKEQLLAFSKGFTTFTAETETLTKSGKKKKLIMKVQLKPTTEFGEKVALFSAIDITELKKTEKALKESEEKYRNIFENSPIGIASFDTKGNPLNINNKLLEILGSPSIEATKKINVLSFKPLVDIGFSKCFLNCLEKSSIESDETQYKSKWNKEIELRYIITPFHNDKNDVSGVQAIFEDVSERKFAEEKERMLHMSYSSIFNNATDAIYIQDREGRFLDVNESVIKMYGFPKDEFIGNTPEFLSADGKNDLEKISNYIKDAFNNKPVQFEFWGKRKNGEIFPKLVRVKKGSYLGKEVVIAFALDITKQKNREKELQRWADVFKHSKWGVVVGSANERKLELMNPAFAEMHGYTVEELKGKPVDMLFTPKEREKIPTFIREAYEKGNINFETEHLRKDGSSFPIFANVTATKDEKGNLQHRIVNIHDITQLKDAEAIIERERDQAQKYLDVAGVMMGVLDINGTVTLMNRKGCEILGYNENEIIGKNWFDTFLVEDDIELVKDVFTQIMNVNLENVEYYENQLKTKDGQLKTIAFHNTILENNNSEITGVLFSGEDITLQKETLNQLEKSKVEIGELAQYLQDIREEERHHIATEIHDDLGQSLTALKLDTSILLSKLPDADPEIIKKIISMKGLTDQTIKTVQKISSELRPGILDDLGLAAAIEWETKVFEERTNIKCKLTLWPFDISFNQKINITIFRLFQEACTNVARHSQATKLAIKIVSKNKRITIRMKDNGIGITEEQIISSKSFGIVGMRERLKSLNGNIIFTSKPNEGTTLEIKIPLED